MGKSMQKTDGEQPQEEEVTQNEAPGNSAANMTGNTVRPLEAQTDQKEEPSEAEQENEQANANTSEAESADQLEHSEQEDPGAQAQQDAPDELTLIQQQLAEKEAEAKENYDRLLRERAELENFKRRMQREKSESIRYASEPLLRDILPVVDNLERAVAHAKDSEGGSALVEGVELVLRSFIDTMEKHGVSRVKAKGEAFDPTQHEAVTQVENNEVAPNTVLDELQSGYQLHDRLLRPAMVSVSKASAPVDKAQEEKSET